MRIVILLCLVGTFFPMRSTPAVEAPETGLPGEVTRIGSAKELQKAKKVLDPKLLDKLNAKLDFEKEELVIVRWQGSGQDMLTAEVKKEQNGPVVHFSYKKGATDDLRNHQAHFLLPKKAKWKVETQ